MKKALNILSREAGQFMALLFCLIVLIWFFGCQSKTLSLHNDGRRVTRDEIQMEVDTFMRLAEIRFADLKRQEAFKAALLDAAVITTQTGTINPYGIIATLLGAVGIGATVDNVRKRIVIKKLNNKTTPNSGESS